MNNKRGIRKLSKKLLAAENERDKYQAELLSDISNLEASQNFSNASDEIETLRDNIKLIKKEWQE